MVDRELTFSDPAIVEMLNKDFVPVAIDQWYQRRQSDAEGEFYRKIASQGPRSDFQQTTQGRYMATAAGQLLGFNNNRGTNRLKPLMQSALTKFAELDKATAKRISSSKRDPKRHIPPPDGTLVISVNAQVLGGYEETDNWTRVFQDAISRDNLWIRKTELPDLVSVVQKGGPIPSVIAKRIARFHLVDNTRGEPPRWSNQQIKKLSLTVDDQGTIRGKVHLETASGDRGYVAELLGKAATDGEKISRFDLVAKGQFWGCGRYTHHAPEGKFPLAIAFRIADDSKPYSKIMPHGSKGWLQGYWQSERRP